jgi:hypothetical protein
MITTRIAFVSVVACAAALLDEFAGSLKYAEQPARAAEIASRSAALKAAHPGAAPNFQPRRYRG